ncbi:Hypothetical predicted protein [Octopus vulgaris]|uniref:Cyanocobalamin reductase (cyanide-eliminating) n=1 Tax=Octopus vulgaris TaxID=6645 RepID=A0AA36B2K2_OCTVU|nr:Hypothetical predicted protein [Octopus vulgaris]
MKPSFRLKYSRNTLALTVVAAPDMFEKTLLPCICKSNVTVLLDGDPTDNCNQKYFKKFFAIYPETDFLSSYKMLGPGHPLVLSQTAAHVSGAAYYYQRRDVPRDTWPANKGIKTVQYRKPERNPVLGTLTQFDILNRDIRESSIRINKPV